MSRFGNQLNPQIPNIGLGTIRRDTGNLGTPNNDPVVIAAMRQRIEEARNKKNLFGGNNMSQYGIRRPSGIMGQNMAINPRAYNASGQGSYGSPGTGRLGFRNATETTGTVNGGAMPGITDPITTQPVPIPTNPGTLPGINQPNRPTPTTGPHSVMSPEFVAKQAALRQALMQQAQQRRQQMVNARLQGRQGGYPPGYQGYEQNSQAALWGLR